MFVVTHIIFLEFNGFFVKSFLKYVFLQQFNFEDLDLMLPESRQQFIAGMNLPLQCKQIFEDQILEFLNEIV